MNKLEYQPGIGGQAVQLDGPTSFVGTAENLRSREWTYELGYRDLVSATRPAREVDVDFNAKFADADVFRRVADADVMAKTPGTFVAQDEWKQRGYVLASSPNSIHYGDLSTTLKVALLDGAWWRLASKSFRPENTVIDKEYATRSGYTVTASGAANAPLNALTIYGRSVQEPSPSNGASVPIQVVEPPNLIPYDIDTLKTYNTSGTWSGNVYTYRTIQTTFNSDGTITLNGTASGTYTLYLVPNSNQLSLADGDYTLTGEIPGTGSDSTWYFQATATSDSSGTVKARNRDYGSGVTFSVDSTVYGVSVYFHAATGDYFDNAVLKPQLVAGSQVQPFVPYGCIGLKVDSTVTPIDLDGKVLASLPDGTQDVITVSSAGAVTLTKRVSVMDLSSLTWYSYQDSNGKYYHHATQAVSDLKPWTDDRNLPGLLAEKFVRDQWYIVANYYAPTTLRWKISQSPTDNVFYARTDGTAYTKPTGLCYYPLAQETTYDLGTITMPDVTNNSQISIVASIAPSITAKYEISQSLFLDYPHDYEYDYLARAARSTVESSVLTPSNVRIIIYGPCDNPYVIVGDNRYQVNVGVPAGGYMIIDGRDKTIMLTLADGTVQNVFGDGVRGGGVGSGEYIFERIPGGIQEVEWDGSFGFEVGWYEEEGEPPWSQS